MQYKHQLVSYVQDRLWRRFENRGANEKIQCWDALTEFLFRLDQSAAGVPKLYG
jgi:hypothetical protein